jgi:endonuclease/exonuclease/phosphatase (EEP) superfamily protein YafD
MVAPIMSLDHVWLSKHFRVVRCEHRTSIYSDHRAVVVDLAWK